MKLLKAIFKKREPELPVAVQLAIVGESRVWYKNGNHRLKQEIIFYDADGNKIGFGRINRKYKPKNKLK